MNKRTFSALAILVALFTVSCQLFGSKAEGVAVAKVHNVYLYEEDIQDFNIPSGLTEKDSVALLTEHIDNWATKQLLLDKAKENMSGAQQKKFTKMVDAYEMDLFISAYQNVYVQKKLNTVITDQEVNAYFAKHKQSFLSKETLVKARYIKLPLNYKDVNATKKIFTRFNDEDLEELNKMRPGFVTLDFNEEDTWQTYEELIEELPKLASLNKAKVLNTKNIVQFSDSKGKYLLKFYKILRKGNIAPVEYASTTIKQILLNKRKLELQQKLEKEITKDALQTKDYTIFE